jgi:hypothetical protein
MKHFAYVLLLGALAGMGCVSTHEHLSAKKAATQSMPVPPPVTAAQINPENAHDMSQALWDELERQMHSEMATGNAARSIPPSK